MNDLKGGFSKTILFVISIFLFSCSKKTDQANFEIEVDTQNLVHEIQPNMYGVFFEDINSAADGGIYAELVKNRSFEFEDPWMGWKHLPEAETRFNTQNELTLVSDVQNNPTNKRFLRIDKRKDEDTFGLQNEGFSGMGIKKSGKYDFSFFAKLNSGKIEVKASLVDSLGNSIGSTVLQVNSNTWTKYEGVIEANETVKNAKLNVTFKGLGKLDVDFISLFPQDTWKGRKGGLRKDLVQLLADMKPGFVRFPGGCIVEGRTLDERYQWKKTLGNPENRETLINRWNIEFKHRPAPDYFQTFGLGFYEYFQLSEDLNAEPLPILSCGLACQFNTSETVPMEELDLYIDDALDLIEFANGSITSKWGKIRSEMGHPEPFNLKYIGVGNEQWGNEYFERYAEFSKAIRAKYPEIKIVSGTGPSDSGELFDMAEKALIDLKPDIVDEHYYKDPKWFLGNATRYDNYDRNRYKIFAGEYAAQSVATVSPDNKNNLECALAEAAFMTGLERNADVVYLASYAPLFAHVDRWQWTPDLIWFDNLSSFGTANYYVQKLFSEFKGTHTLNIKMNGENITGQNGIYASSSLDKKTNEVIVKLVNAGDHTADISINFKGVSGNKTGEITSLSNEDKLAYNTITKPELIVPVEKKIDLTEGGAKIVMEPNSFKVLRFKN